MQNKPAVIFPDVVLWALGYLRTALTARPVGETFADDVFVQADTPATIPARLVTVRDDGGRRLPDVRKVASLGVNVYAATKADCANLANLVAAIFEAAPGSGAVVGHVGTSGPYPVPEASLKPHRYLSVDLVVRGVAL